MFAAQYLRLRQLDGNRLGRLRSYECGAGQASDGGAKRGAARKTELVKTSRNVAEVTIEHLSKTP